MELRENQIKQVAAELGLKPHQVNATVSLLDEGSTVPFIARYRKEATGELDEVVITNIRDRITELREMDKRREAILKSLQERELLTDELEAKVMAAATLSALEDVYLPFRPKRRTRATMAREKGLEPLAKLIFTQEGVDPAAEAEAFVDEQMGVSNVQDALAGARDIMAEWISEDQSARQRLRTHFLEQGVIVSGVIKNKEEEGAKFKDYFEWNEPAKKAPSHRILALRRGETEGVLFVRYQPPEEPAIEILERLFVKGEAADSAEVRVALEDSYSRLLSISMETELRLTLKKRADEEAVRVFKDNLRQLLLAPPLGQKNVLAIDPGFRTGCKVVCLDRQGALKHFDTIYLLGNSTEKAAHTIRVLCEKFDIDAIAIGNGTASRETETFIRALGLPASIDIVMVNESGASIYSASEAAREEFPNEDITVRGSVSIGRRLMDPLAELVKIDPKSIGVGQYQHDVDQSMLRQSLDDVVESCVNAVGVEVNTASPHLLSYVSGLGPVLSKNIAAYRQEQGAFKSRAELKKVPRLGPKAFEQAAGFLRIREAKNPLDASAVHPESYHIVKQMAGDLGVSVSKLMQSDELRADIKPEQYVTDTVGLPTLSDIMTEISKPGRDPRAKFESFAFMEGVNELKDLEAGMRLPGIVTNVTNFGAFVDVGVHQDGLVHISQIADRFVRNPADVLKVGQHVMAKVLEVDIKRRRISLTLKSDKPKGDKPKSDKPKGDAPKVGNPKVGNPKVGNPKI